MSDIGTNYDKLKEQKMANPKFREAYFKIRNMVTLSEEQMARYEITAPSIPLDELLDIVETYGYNKGFDLGYSYSMED